MANIFAAEQKCTGRRAQETVVPKNSRLLGIPQKCVSRVPKGVQCHEAKIGMEDKGARDI